MVIKRTDTQTVYKRTPGSKSRTGRRCREKVIDTLEGYNNSSHKGNETSGTEEKLDEK